MKATVFSTGAFLGLALTASLASAGGVYYSPVFNTPLAQAPNTYGPGFYVICPNGVVYGPNYCLRPPELPYAPPIATPTQAIPAFPSHPYARSPRDFFMWRENMEDQLRRTQRPNLVP